MARFGTPLVLGMLLYTLFNLIDMFMISRLENRQAALGALAICDMVAALATIVSNGISTGTVAILSRRVGEGDHGGATHTLWQSMVLVGFLSVVFGGVGLFGSELIVTEVMRAKGEVARLAAQYLKVLMGGSFSIFFLLQITAILRALGHSKAAAGLLVSGNVLNIVLNAFLIYGQGPYPDAFAWAGPIAAWLEVPRLGMQGAAWSTLIGRTVPVFVGVLLLVRATESHGLRAHHFIPNRAVMRSLLRIGWPSSAQLVLRIGAVLVFISLINSNYTTALESHTLTAYSVCLRLETLVLFVGMGWGAAASTFVGMNLGAQNPRRAHRAGWVAALYNGVTTAALAALFVAYATPIVGFFDSEPAVLAMSESYMRTIAPSYVLLAAALVLSQAMTGAGATLTNLVIDAVVLLIFIVPCSIVVAEILALSPRALWVTIAAGNVVAATVFTLCYSRGRFLTKRI